MRELNLSVESSRTEESWVEGIVTVGGHDNLDICRLVESVHLGEEFDEDSLDLTICSRLGVVSLGGDGVDLIYKNNTGRVISGESEDVSDHSGSLSDVLLHELTAVNSDEGGRGMVRDGLREHGFSGTGRSVHEDSSGRVDTDLLVELWVGEGEFDGFSDLLFLLVKTSDILVGYVRLLLDLHHLDLGIGLVRHDLDDGVC